MIFNGGSSPRIVDLQKKSNFLLKAMPRVAKDRQ